jgi:negative regulator of flagellin synthesis FlgM
MSTKINGLETRPAAPVATAPIARTKDSFTADGAPLGAGSDGVQITETARRLASLEKLVARAPEVDLDKVAEANLAIEQGLFQIQPERIAEQLVRLEQSLARAAGRTK